MIYPLFLLFLVWDDKGPDKSKCPAFKEARLGQPCGYLFCPGLCCQVGLLRASHRLAEQSGEREGQAQRGVTANADSTGHVCAWALAFLIDTFAFLVSVKCI